jgi:Ras-related protein Rab-1A
MWSYLFPTTSPIVEQHDHAFKVIIIGNSCIGKSSILLNFTDGIFDENFITTIGVDFRVRNFDIDGKKVKIHFFDSGGQDRFRSITSSYYRGSHGIILMYDVSDKESFEDVVPIWMNDIKLNCEEKVSILLVGNKCDLENRKISFEQGKELAETLGIDFIETSAKKSINVKDAFERIATLLYHIHKNAAGAAASIKLYPVPCMHESKEDNKSSCC